MDCGYTPSTVLFHLNKKHGPIECPKEVLGLLASYATAEKALMEDHKDKLDGPEQLQERISILKKGIANLEATKTMRKQREQLKRNLSKLEWSLAIHEDFIRKELFLQLPMAIIALMRKNKQWFVLMWVGERDVDIVEVETLFVKKFLSDRAFQNEKFHGPQFGIVGRYDRRETLESETFKGIRKVGPFDWEVCDVNGAIVGVSNRWVRKQVDMEYMSAGTYAMAVEQCKSGILEFVLMVPGGSTHLDALHQANANIIQQSISTLPVLKYKMTQNMCLTEALASALHFKGHWELAQRIWQKAKNELVLDSAPKVIESFRLMVNQILKKSQMKLLKMKYYNPRHKDTWTPNIVVGQLKGNRGINHCVAFVGGMVFDPNFHQAMPITMNSLETICGGASYRSMWWAYEVVSKPKPPPQTKPSPTNQTSGID